MIPDANLVDYYARRAREYEKIFARSERQQDLASLRSLLLDLLAGHNVLEVACGTGWWTQSISETAKSILATDINEEVLEIARRKTYPRGKVRFLVADAYTLTAVAGEFTAAFAGFWWSHVPRQNLRAFLDAFHRKLRPAARVVFLDNNYVEGGSTPISRCDLAGNTYQKRKLDDGTECEVLKNFPNEAELRSCVRGAATNVEIAQLKYYWLLSYLVRPA